jgi:HEAT repeats
MDPTASRKHSSRPLPSPRRTEKTGPALAAICRESSDPAVRRAALQGLFLQQNDEALVEVARAEKDPAVRREAVRYLSLLGSALSREFLSEILDK